MSNIGRSDSSQGIFESEQSIVAFTRDWGCWHCEKPLPPGFCAARGFPSANALFEYPILFLTCGPMCQKHVLAVLQKDGFWTESWAPSRVRRFADDTENLMGTLQDLTLGLVLKANRS
jgi:hypothetical protein